MDDCGNCDGHKCMDCVLRYQHEYCTDSCPFCCTPRDRAKWTWDPDVNMGYLALIPDRQVHVTHQKSGGGDVRINVDFDVDGNVVGVEVFG